MTYDETLEYIHSIKKFNTKPGLHRIENLLRELGNPEKRMRYIHIAGTNGKGSATAMCASVLQTAGYKVGSFISPFLERFNERMQIDGVPIPDDRLITLTERVKAAADRMTERGLAHPTEFEFVTAMAFEYWAEEGCDFVSLEVGMGGRLDATNVIPSPDAAIIAHLDLDHCHYLGYTLTEIAYEKCGIIKRGSPVICYCEQADESIAVTKKVCAERGAAFIKPDMSKLEILSEGIEGSRFVYDGTTYDVPLMGRHQIMNTLGVIEAIRALKLRGVCIPDSVIAEGIRNTKWVGRLEIIRRDPMVIIDAAHNPDAVRVLTGAIDKLMRGRRIVAVMGILADKDYHYCIPEIAKRADAFVACTPTSGRALDAADCAEVAKPHCPHVEAVPDIAAAVDRGLELTGSDDVMLICGSLYVIGNAKTHIRSKK